MDIFKKLAETENKYNEINERLSDPGVVSDQVSYTALMKELKHLTPIIEKYKEYKNAEQTANDATEMLGDAGDDKAFKAELEKEIESAKAAMNTTAEELQFLLLPRDEDDDKNVIVEIRGGAGGEESALFAYNLYRMYTMYADRKGWKHEIINLNETELGGFKEVSFEISGDGAYSRLKFESGVHRVQRVPETESQGRVHTSTVTVAVLPEAEEVELDIDSTQIQVDTFRASGAGGQHVNKTESAIRLTYLPTGLVVECQDERSQHKNKDKAMKVLRSKLLEQQRAAQDAEIAGARKAQVGTGDRSERIRTYNFPQGRISDHRIGLTLYHIEQNMNGDIDEIIEALIMADRLEKLNAE